MPVDEPQIADVGAVMVADGLVAGVHSTFQTSTRKQTLAASNVANPATMSSAGSPIDESPVGSVPSALMPAQSPTCPSIVIVAA